MATLLSRARPVLPRAGWQGLRLWVFIREVLTLSITCFGGPQAHIALFRERLVDRRGYLTDAELLELYALCQILPGPTSTQTLTAIAFRIGGPWLAYMTLVIWVLPSAIMMATLGWAVAHAEPGAFELGFTRLLAPIAVGIVLQAALTFSARVINNQLDAALMLGAGAVTFLYPSPYVTPLLLLAAGAWTAIRHRRRIEIEEKLPWRISWANFLLWGGVFILAGLGGQLIPWLPLRLFENFYRNGSLVFGGGQVLVPLMYTEFVQYKGYLTQQEFLFGYAVSQSLPGPVFSYCTYVGILAGRPLGPPGMVAGALAATAGIFLPGTFLIFFIIRFWAQLKRYRVVRAAIEGVNAASAGLIWGAGALLFKPIEASELNIGLIVASALILRYTHLPSWVLIGLGLLGGVLLTWLG